MALHDYTCLSCGRDEIDVFRPITEKATANPPLCCNLPMAWLPQIGRMDALSSPFTTTIRQPDGSYKEVTVRSLSQIRQIERDSEVAYRNGEGQPMRWRDYSNDRSNADVNTFGESPAEQAPTRTSRGEPITVRRGPQVAEDHGE